MQEGLAFSLLLDSNTRPPCPKEVEPVMRRHWQAFRIRLGS